jgi:hypothetical protein
MTGPPAGRPFAESAPSVNRAQQTVMVRLHNGDSVGRVSVVFADILLTSGAAQSVGKTRLRYIRLEPGIVISKSSHGWTTIDKERRKYGDSAVRRGLMAFERRSLKWQAPTRNPLLPPHRAEDSC